MSKYLGNQPITKASYDVKEFTATEGQTTFNLSYNPNFLDVLVRGVQLAKGDYIATDGWVVTLNEPVTAGFVVTFKVWGTFNPVDTYTRSEVDAKYAAVTSTVATLFNKKEYDTAAFEVSGSDLITTSRLLVDIDGHVVDYPQGEPVTLPILVNATDYKIYADASGLVAQAWDVAAPANSVLLGGFHVYHTTGGINPYSIWDLKWRPTCNPRGMTINPGKSAWGDIYFMDVDYGINGFSRADVKIADGENAASFPKKPIMYGGDGTATYGNFTWFVSQDLARAHGKRLFSEGEYSHFAYGVVEEQSVGTDPINTRYQAGHRSLCGLEQATGVMWIWGGDIQGNSAGTGSTITDGRGSIYHSELTAVLLGAVWVSNANAGSRSASWNNLPSHSQISISGRGACDHQIIL